MGCQPLLLAQSWWALHNDELSRLFLAMFMKESFYFHLEEYRGFTWNVGTSTAKAGFRQ